jgi:transcriptional regulatory protein RtcR
VTVDIVNSEIARLRLSWRRPTDTETDVSGHILDADELLKIDHFDRVQLAEVLKVCRASRSLSEAGRKLFNVSRTRKGTANDADRLRKYLARFSLDWAKVTLAS